MDPISQGALGAVVPLALLGKRRPFALKWIATLGALSGMAPDLDVLIRSSEDPLLAIEFHRHFTHSLAFVPFGALLALLPWLYRKEIRQHFGFAHLVSFLGYLTHAPLDCFTTYGTQLYWPFSSERVALSWVSVVDPLFTLPLIAFVLLACFKQKALYARIGLVYCLSYLALGGVQHGRALALQARILEARGHEADRREALTTFMNQVTWRSIYEEDGRAYIDQIRVPYLGKACLKEGSSAPLAYGPPADAGPIVRDGFARASWFAHGWVAYSDDYNHLLGDLRYSFTPYGLVPFWGLGFDLDKDEVRWVNTGRERNFTLTALIDLIFNNPEGSICWGR